MAACARLMNNSFHLRLGCWLLALAGFLLPARAALVNGHSYVPLAAWAAANQFSITRNDRSDEFTLASRNTRLVFAKDSDIVTINGIRVVLAFPLAVDHGYPLISQLDLAKTIFPLAFPPHLNGHRLTTICLDPGHGGKDTGYRFGSHNEKTYTLALAQDLHDQLVQAGFKVILTRTRDEYVDLPERPNLANRAGADLFISLHFNCSTVDADHVQGPETYCITPVGASSSNSQGEGADHGPAIANRVESKSLWFAYEIQRSLVKNLGVEDREVRRARFAVLRDAEMPAILIENGYMSHPVEGRKIFTAAYRHQLAAAIVRGVLNYQRLLSPVPSATMMATGVTPLPHKHYQP